MDTDMHTYGGIHGICGMHQGGDDPNEQDLSHRGNNPDREAFINKH